MKMRYLQDNKRTTAPSELCFIAVGGTEERVRDRPRRTIVSYSCHVAEFLRLEGSEITRQHTQVSTSADAFWSYLDGRMNKSRPVLIVGYDMSRILTLLGLWRLLDAGRYGHKHIVDGDPPVIVPIYSGKCQAVFCDLRNWFREPWSELSVLVNGTARPLQCVDTEPSGLLDRSVYDCRIVRDIMLSYIEYVRSHDLGNLRRTVGMQSLAAYRHRFGPRKSKVVIATGGHNAGEPVKKTMVFPLCHDNEPISKLERKANFGGREECYYVGKIEKEECFWINDYLRNKISYGPWVPGPVYLVDVNSLYPFVMTEHKFPYKLEGWQHKSTVPHLHLLAERFCIIADVLLDTDVAYPHRTREGRIIYPVGRYWTTLAGTELTAALKAGHVKEVGLHSAYRTMDLFTEYVGYFWALKNRYRETGNRVYYHLTKTLLNSLWGKFCQRGYFSKLLPDWKCQARWGKEWVIDSINKEDYEVQYRAGVAWRVDRTEVAVHALPAIGACVTAAARVKMREYMSCLGPRDCLYMGVDSLILTESGYQRLCKSWELGESGLGQMRLVGTYETGVIRSQQDYQLGNDKVVRGLTHAARQCGYHAYTFDQRVGLAGQLSTIPQEHIAYCEVNRNYSGNYYGRVVGKDGWTEPIRLDTTGGDENA